MQKKRRQGILKSYFCLFLSFFRMYGGRCAAGSVPGRISNSFGNLVKGWVRERESSRDSRVRRQGILDIRRAERAMQERE